MTEIEQLLRECEKRMEETSNIIIENMKGDAKDFELSKLLEAAKVMDELKLKAKREQNSVDHCKQMLSQATDPWDLDIQKMFSEEMDKSNKASKKNRELLHNELKKHIDCLQGVAITGVENDVQQAIDPWTRQPITNPVQSTTCKHLYDKKSINCIIKTRPQFKCPYVGCQCVIRKEHLLEYNEDTDDYTPITFN